MPEIAEVARIVHYLRKRLVNQIVKTVEAQHDENVYGKVGTSAEEFRKAMTGKKIVGAGQQGKYFWLLMESPPHPVFHFGMTGWFHIRGEPVAHYRPRDDAEEVWPPKYWKFTLSTLAAKGEEPVEAAFTDARRFARIRLVDCAAEDIRKTTPLKENGPDPVIDKDILTEEWLEKKMRSKHVPVKALMLDQANISGIGNWVGDEILYNAKLHPEQYSDTFNSEQLQRLHASIMYVCDTAVALLADSSKFPDTWLFHHRWGKGKKDAPTTLPSGEKITFLTVGGRTSCVVPSIQKKTGAVAGDVDANGSGKGTRKRKNAVEEDASESEDTKTAMPPSIQGPKIKSEGDETKTSKKRKTKVAAATPSVTKVTKKELLDDGLSASTRRRSSRNVRE